MFDKSKRDVATDATGHTGMFDESHLGSVTITTTTIVAYNLHHCYLTMGYLVIYLSYRQVHSCEWENKNWDSKIDASDFDRFCETLDLPFSRVSAADMELRL